MFLSDSSSRQRTAAAASFATLGHVLQSLIFDRLSAYEKTCRDRKPCRRVVFVRGRAGTRTSNCLSGHSRSLRWIRRSAKSSPQKSRESVSSGICQEVKPRHPVALGFDDRASSLSRARFLVVMANGIAGLNRWKGFCALYVKRSIRKC